MKKQFSFGANAALTARGSGCLVSCIESAIFAWLASRVWFLAYSHTFDKLRIDAILYGVETDADNRVCIVARRRFDMSVMSALALAQRESVQTQLAQEMKRLQGRANFRRRVGERIRKKAQDARDRRLDAFNKALDAALAAESARLQGCWDSALAAVLRLEQVPEGDRDFKWNCADIDARRNLSDAWWAWCSFTKLNQNFAFIVHFKLAYEDR